MAPSQSGKHANNGLTEEEKISKRRESNRQASKRLLLKKDQRIQDLVSEISELEKELKHFEEKREMKKQENNVLLFQNDFLRSLNGVKDVNVGMHIMDGGDGVEIPDISNDMFDPLPSLRNLELMSDPEDSSDSFDLQNLPDPLSSTPNPNVGYQQWNVSDPMSGVEHGKDPMPGDLLEEWNEFGLMQQSMPNDWFEQ